MCVLHSVHSEVWMILVNHTCSPFSHSDIWNLSPLYIALMQQLYALHQSECVKFLTNEIKWEISLVARWSHFIPCTTWCTVLFKTCSVRLFKIKEVMSDVSPHVYLNPILRKSCCVCLTLKWTKTININTDMSCLLGPPVCYFNHN